MELNLQPRAEACCVSGQPFREGDRVASLLVIVEGGAVARYDALEAAAASLSPAGFVACRWVQAYKPRAREENRDRAIKLTAENLFVTLADPSTQASPETDRLVRFLALLLERKRILRPRGTSPDGSRELFEHARTKQVFEVAALQLTPEFFTAVQGQLAVLVGEPKAREPSPEPAAAPAE
ncbi:MAG TPA: hypothetical protein VGG34_02740 [Opitutaceae bacterium]|jgi:hypothetical protein